MLAITDHWHITPYEHESILVLPSAELSGAIEGELEEADVLAYGIDELPEARERFPSIGEAASWIVAQGGVAYLAHPYWSALSAEHYLGAPDLSGMEVFNGGAEQQQGNGLSVVHWDGMLAAGRECHGIATDDSHYAGRDSRLAWTMVAGARAHAPAVLGAAERRFYGSSGPRSTTCASARTASRCAARPRARSTLRSGRWDGCKVNAGALGMSWRGRVTERCDAGAITAARLELPEFHALGPHRGRGRDGGRAWSGVVLGCPGEGVCAPSRSPPVSAGRIVTSYRGTHGRTEIAARRRIRDLRAGRACR